MPSRPEDWEFDRWDDRDSGVVVLRFGIMLEPRHDVTSSITVYSHPHKLVAVRRRWIEIGPKDARALKQVPIETLVIKPRPDGRGVDFRNLQRSYRDGRNRMRWRNMTASAASMTWREWLAPSMLYVNREGVAAAVAIHEAWDRSLGWNPASEATADAVAYPLLAENGITPPQYGIQYGLVTFARAATVKEGCERIFGKTGVNRRLIRVVATALKQHGGNVWPVISVSAQFARLLDPDTIATRIEQACASGSHPNTAAPRSGQLRRLALLWTSKPRRVEILEHALRNNNWLLSDTLRMARPDIDIKALPGWSETWRLQNLHDALTFVPLRNEHPDATRLPEWPDALAEICGKPINVPLAEGPVTSLRIRPALTAGELYEWGASMHHCIGTYVKAALTKRALLASVEDQDGRMLYNLDIDVGGRQQPAIRQLLGPHNSSPLDGHRKAITAAFTEAQQTAKHPLLGNPTDAAVIGNRMAFAGGGNCDDVRVDDDERMYHDPFAVRPVPFPALGPNDF